MTTNQGGTGESFLRHVHTQLLVIQLVILIIETVLSQIDNT